MPLWPQFVNGASEVRSRTLDAEQCINLYPESLDSPANPKRAMLVGTPGLRHVLRVATSPCRGLWAQDGRVCGVWGDTFYELDLAAPTATSRGTIPDDGQPVSFASNGRGGEQLAVCGGGQLNVYDLRTNTLSSAVTLPLTQAPVQLGFLDGYGLLTEADTVRVWFSALEDFTSFDALDFFAKNESSDNTVGLATLSDRVYVFGTQTTLLYVDTGDADTPFLPYPSSLQHIGCVTPWSIARQGDALYWLAQDDQGRPSVQRIGGQGRAEISTPALVFALESYPRIDNCEVLSYEQHGHPFVCWFFPSASPCGVAWCWDARESQWHQRASWDQTLGQFFRWRPRGVCATPDQGVLVGDYATGDLYQLDLGCYTENGDLIRRVRRAPYLSTEAELGFIDQFELGMQAGVGRSSGPGADPQVMLTLSRDAGQTWSAPQMASLGKQGEYLTRAVWRRLGRSRMDRFVVEISTTEPVPIVLGPGAWLRVQAGSRNL